MSPTWMPFYVGDYARATLNLTTQEHGAYLLLILHYWDNGGIPDDDEELAVITRLTMPEWQKARQRLSRLFLEGWKHKRIDEELAKAAEKYAKRAAAGKAGGNASAAAKQKASKRPSNAGPDDTSNGGSNAPAKSNQPQPPKEERKEDLGKSGLEEVAISPRDPVLNGSLPEWRAHYTPEVIAELQLRWEHLVVEDEIPALWDWSFGKADTVYGRMQKIWTSLERKNESRAQAPEMLATKRDPPSIAISASVASSRMAQKSPMRRTA